jgi:hypothetical protein
MNMWCEQSQEPPVVAVYMRCSSPMQLDNCSREAQIRAIVEECQRLNLPPPIFFIEDDECSARDEQIT